MADRTIHISITRQTLELKEGDQLKRRYVVSTAKNGPGEQEGSECTPRGRHRIAEKIGGDADVGTVFVGRRPTGEIYSPALREAHPGRDWILTRILWLDGLEPGRNRGGDVDTHARYVYLHGTPDSTPLGEPGSRGCVRMANSDIIELFELVDVDTAVMIEE